MPEVRTINVPSPAELGVAIEGSAESWPGSSKAAALPSFDVYNQQHREIEVFNRGRTAFSFTTQASVPWISVSPARGRVDKQQTLSVSVDWTRAPQGLSDGSIIISGAGRQIPIKVDVLNPQMPSRASLDGYVEADGYVSIEAEHFTRKVDAGDVSWDTIADYGRTLSSVTVFPVTAASVNPPSNSPRLEYKMYLFHAGKVEVEATLAPSLNFVPGRGLRYAISFDDQPPQVVDALAQNSVADWSKAVEDSVRKVSTTLTVSAPGDHTLKVWMVDTGIVLQKIVVDTGGMLGMLPTYLGPPESYHAGVH
jgi:hypothetical protein